MKKYLSLFKISFQQEFAYKVNFIMWRVRNVFQIIITFYLWDAVFSDSGRQVFGYDKAKILTYVFALMVVRALVLSARAVDVSSDVSEGNLSNHLLKPISYFKYWMTRDISSKALNLSFAALEFGVLYLILKPPFYFQTNPVTLLTFAVSVIIAALIYFCILFLISAVPFWAPELGWASQFLVAIVVVEFLSGALFPIDILPQVIQNTVMALPFPYMIFFPVQVYLGKVSPSELVQGLVISSFWMVTLWHLMKYTWRKGLRQYQAFGR